MGVGKTLIGVHDQWSLSEIIKGSFYSSSIFCLFSFSINKGLYMQEI